MHGPYLRGGLGHGGNCPGLIATVLWHIFVVFINYRNFVNMVFLVNRKGPILDPRLSSRKTILESKEHLKSYVERIAKKECTAYRWGSN